MRLEQGRRDELQRLGLDHVPTNFVWVGDGGLRDRLEFTLEPDGHGGSRLGLFEKTKRHVVDIDICPQLSPELQLWLSEFRRDLPLVQSPRSVRLRVSPAGLRGVWLDFANEDIRDLLDDGAWLSRRLSEGVIVEVGQKRKRVVANSEGPRAHRLVDPTLEAWFETAVLDRTADDLKTAKLFSTIGTFTQPGFKSTRALVETVFDHIRQSFRAIGLTNRQFDDFSDLRFAEFGAGIGSFTLPLLSTGAAVEVFETDRLALAALEKGVETAGLDRTRLKIHAGDFILSARAASNALKTNEQTPVHYDMVVVDPPRPGLGHFIDAISGHARGANWIYVSCYPESFAKDAEALRAKGLTLQRLTVVEQFPFTRHFELVATFTAQP